MKMVDLTMEIPEDAYQVFAIAGLSEGKKLSKEIRKASAIGFYQQHLLTLQQASGLAGMSLEGFMDLLIEDNIPVFEYTRDDYIREERSTEEVWKKISQEEK